MIIEYISHGGKGYSQMTPAQLLEAGVPQAVIDAALSDARRLVVKAECRRRIFAVANETAQANMTAAVTVVSAKTAASRSTQEAQMLTTFGEGVAWIAAMRANVATLTADANADFRADAAWPACPPAVIALAASF